LVERLQVVVGWLTDQMVRVQVNASSAAAFGGVLGTGVIDQDAAHRLGRRLQIVVPRRERSLAAELQVRFVNQRRGVEGVPRLLAGELRGGELAKFVVYLGQQLGRLHFFSGVLLFPCGYFTRSACHFLASSGLLIAVYSSISRSRASGMRNSPPPCCGM